MSWAWSARNTSPAPVIFISWVPSPVTAFLSMRPMPPEPACSKRHVALVGDHRAELGLDRHLVELAPSAAWSSAARRRPATRLPGSARAWSARRAEILSYRGRTSRTISGRTANVKAGALAPARGCASSSPGRAATPTGAAARTVPRRPASRARTAPRRPARRERTAGGTRARAAGACTGGAACADGAGGADGAPCGAGAGAASEVRFSCAATISLKSCGEVATRSASSKVIRPACRWCSRCWSNVCMP